MKITSAANRTSPAVRPVRQIVALFVCLLLPALTGFAALQATPAPATPASQPASQPSSRPTVLQATDTAALKAAVKQQVTVVGEIRSAKLSSTGRVFRIEFKDAGASGFNAPLFPADFPAFEAALGKDLSAALTGKTVEITGTLSEYRGSPQIILTSPAQLTLR